MGEISEYYRDHSDWEFDDDKKFGHYIDTDIAWKTAKGKWIRVENMTTSHILNLIRAWEGLGKTEPPKGYLGGKKKWIDILTNELIRRNKNG